MGFGFNRESESNYVRNSRFMFVLEFSKFRAMSVEKDFRGPGYTSQSFGDVRTGLVLLFYIDSQ